MKRGARNRTSNVAWFRALAALAPTILIASSGRAEQPPPPCHPNPNAAADREAVANRGDIVNPLQPLKERLIQMADRPLTR